MAERVRSDDLVGREDELRQVEKSLAATAEGETRVLLVAGDAGIGKTSVVRALVSRAHDAGFEVLEGHCLDIEAGVPFGPFLEAIAPLLGGYAHDRARPAAGRVAAMLDPARRAADAEPAALLAGLRQVVDEAVAHGPVLLVLEDMHWVDRSTQDLALSLARTAAGPLLLALTFRTDELTRSHPSRSALFEIGRSPGALRLDLAPLDRNGVQAIVEGATGQRADRGTVADLLARSEGNPLYVEELLAGQPDQVPGPLGDLLLSRLDVLSEPTRSVLHVASVGGTRVDADLVAEVAGLTSDGVDELLEEALGANVLVRDRDHLAFRHGLLRDAIYDDLLPSKRRRLHGAFAAAVQAGIDGAGIAELSQLAFHWYAAHDLPAALAAAVRAGIAAKLYGAPEAIAHFERSLELWDQVPDAEKVSGYAKAELLLFLAEVVGEQGDNKRWRDLVSDAVSQLEPDGDRLLASRVYSELGQLVSLGIVNVAVSEEPLHLALEYAQGPPTRELARALVANAGAHIRGGRYREAILDAARGLEAATTAGCPAEQVSALVETGIAQTQLGESAAGIASIAAAVRTAERNGMTGEALSRQGHLAWYRMMSGDTEGGVRLAARGRAEALAAGLPVVAAFCGEQEIEVMQWQGRWDDTDEMLAAMLAIGMPEYRWRALRSCSLIARGDKDGAAAMEEEIAAGRDRATDDIFEDDAQRLVRLHLMSGDVNEALRVAEWYLHSTADSESPLEAAGSSRMAYQSLAAAGPAGVTPPDGMVERAEGALQRAMAGRTDEWRRSIHGLELLIATGFARRLAGEPAIAQWREAADVAAGLGAWLALEPRLWLAEDLLAQGGRDEGRELLVDVWHAAQALRAGHVEEQVAKLARRSRVPLGDRRDPAGPLNRLTARELEVLQVLATGASNKTIAQRLVISEKTVSVHVTHLIAKLGVTNRGEAAAVARDQSWG